MAIVLFDTQHGVTIALSVDSLTLRVTNVSPAKRTIDMVENSHHGTTTHGTKVLGDLTDLALITITIQSGPSVASPTQVVQTLTITGPTPAGAATGEIMSITGVVSEYEDSPEYATATGGSSALQMKTMIFTPDGTTYTRTVAAT